MNCTVEKNRKHGHTPFIERVELSILVNSTQKIIGFGSSFSWQLGSNWMFVCMIYENSYWREIQILKMLSLGWILKYSSADQSIESWNLKNSIILKAKVTFWRIVFIQLWHIVTMPWRISNRWNFNLEFQKQNWHFHKVGLLKFYLPKSKKFRWSRQLPTLC